MCSKEVGEMTAWGWRSDNKISLEASEVSRLQEITGCRVLKDSSFHRTSEGFLYAIYPLDTRGHITASHSQLILLSNLELQS